MLKNLLMLAIAAALAGAAWAGDSEKKDACTPPESAGEVKKVSAAPTEDDIDQRLKLKIEKTTALGATIAVKDTTAIAAILTAPESYLGKSLLVTGKIVDVCPMAGCWMEVGNDKGQKIKVKVKDGDIVFPLDAKDRQTAVEGELYKIELSVDEAKDYYAHLAEEKGEKFDPATVTAPAVIYQLKGKGAVVHK
jgi:Domain of unknown function (DUF4920)